MGGMTQNSASDGTAGSGSGARDAGHVAPQVWAPLAKPVKRRLKHPAPEDAMRLVVTKVAQALPALAAEHQWVALRRATQFLLWLTQHAPGSASMFLAAKGTARIQEAIRTATSSDDEEAAGMLQSGTALLLQCVQLSEGAADLVVESQSVRLLLQLLQRPTVGQMTRRHIGGVLQALAATKLVYRDVLHGAGVVDALMAALTDAAVLTDLLLVQELLWVLISLADDDLVYKDDMRAAGLPALLVSLFSVYQANQAVVELRPIAAQILRCLQLMADADEAMQVQCAALGLIPLLINQLHLDIHQPDEPLPAAASIVLAFNSLPGTPRSPHAGSVVLGSPSLASPASPLYRSSNEHSSSPCVASAGAGNRRTALEPSIPEDAEADVAVNGGPQPAALHTGRAAGYAIHINEAAPLRSLGTGPSTMQRLAVGVLLRELLLPALSPATIEILLHGMLLPNLYMQLVGPRLSLAAEATFTLRTLLCNSPQRAALAAGAGVAPLLVQLLSCNNLELATAAAEVFNILGNSCPGVLQQLAAPAVAGLTDLLHECAAYSQSVNLTRRLSTASQLSLEGRRRKSVASGVDSPMSPIPETGGEETGLSAAQQAAGTVWTAEQASTGQQVRTTLADVTGNGNAEVLRHPLFRPLAGEQQQQQSNTHACRSFQGVPGSTIGRLSSGLLASRQRLVRPQQRPRGCLVCADSGVELCSYCYLSVAVGGLGLVMQPQPELQAAFEEGAGYEVVVSVIAGLAGGQAEALLISLCGLLVSAVGNSRKAQDQVRLAGGIDVLAAVLKQHLHSSDSREQQAELGASAPAVSAVLHLLSTLVHDNSANKMAVREAGGLSCAVRVMELVLKKIRQPSNGDGSTSEQHVAERVAGAVLSLLAACLPESPGSQALLHQLGGTRLLLTLLRAPSNNPSLGLSTIHVLSLMASRQQPAALGDITAGGLVAVVMSVLQQQAMAGVLVSEVCMNSLPRLLDGNPEGKRQALHYGALPLLVHLLRSSPSPITVTASAHTIAALAERDAELQGQITSAGGLGALLDKLDVSSGAPGSLASAQAEAATAAAAAAASTAAEVVAKSEAASQQHPRPVADDAAAANESGQVDGTADSSTVASQEMPDSSTAAAMAAASADTHAAAANVWQAAAQHRIAHIHVRVACLEAVAALAHNNSFTKNTARQQRVMPLLAELLQDGCNALQAALTSSADLTADLGQLASLQLLPQSLPNTQAGLSRNEHVSNGLLHSSHLRVRTSCSSLAQPATDMHNEQHHQQVAQLQSLVAAVHMLSELCHGNHSNQQAAAAEGLIDQLTFLAAAATGGRLETAGRYASLLSAAFGALAAVVEHCTPNKLVAREAGAVDVASELVLLLAEVPDVSATLSELCIQRAVSSCCAAVVALAQDCEDNQTAFLRHKDFLPALFRLLNAGDASVAAEAARALEFIAIRTDITDDADDRSEFESDTVMALIRALSYGAVAITGSSRTAAARAGVLGAAGGEGSGAPSAATVQEAAALLSLVVNASDPSAQQAAAAAVSASRPAGGAGITAAGLGTAPAEAAARTAPLRHSSLPAGNTGSDVGAGNTSAGTAADGMPTPPQALLPHIVMDHTSGLAVLRTWSIPQDQPSQWQQLVGRCAPAFTVIRAAVPPGPWKAFKEQVSWMLLLLASKGSTNRAIISRVQRTTLTPLAMQLQNAERFSQQVELGTAAAAGAAAGVSSLAPNSLQHTPGTAPVRAPMPASSQKNAPLQSQREVTSIGTSVTVDSQPHTATVRGPDKTTAVDGDAPLPTSTIHRNEDDEFSMLQAEVAFLGLRPRSSSSM